MAWIISLYLLINFIIVLYYASTIKPGETININSLIIKFIIIFLFGVVIVIGLTIFILYTPISYYINVLKDRLNDR